MHLINGDNYLEAADAIRDILMLYVDLADSTAGFGHAANVHVRFDPLKFVDAEVDHSTGYYFVDIDLLRQGSAIAILCEFYDLWSEEQPLSGHMRSEAYETALAAKRFNRFADIEAVLSQAIRRRDMPLDDRWFEEALAPIYRKYVLGFFNRLAASDRYSS